MEVGKSSVNQPGLDPVGGAWKGLHYLAQLCPMRLRTEKMLEFATQLRVTMRVAMSNCLVRNVSG
jgi:hypothetical protein